MNCPEKANLRRHKVDSWLSGAVGEEGKETGNLLLMCNQFLFEVMKCFQIKF